MENLPDRGRYILFHGFRRSLGKVAIVGRDKNHAICLDTCLGFRTRPVAPLRIRTHQRFRVCDLRSTRESQPTHPQPPNNTSPQP